MTRTPKLRTQLAAVMIVAILLAVLFGYLFLNLYQNWQEQVMLASLDATAKHTLAVVNAGGEPSARDMVALYKHSVHMTQSISRQQDKVLIVLTALASITGVGVGLLLASRLARPIEAVGTAARAIAMGDLGVRAAVPQPGAGELSSLVEDFNRMAEALQAFDREVRESSAAIAHELRTPLTILRGRLQGHLDKLFAMDDAALRALIAQVDLLGKIVGDLHVLSMANTGRLELNPSKSELGVLVADQLVALHPAIAEAGLMLETRLEPAPAHVDRQRIGQILLALIDNVLTHAAGGGVVRVETGRRGNGVFLSVLDRGPGLPPGTGEQVFERFWRAEPSRSRQHGGSGLGMAVVKAIVIAHGGTVTAECRAGGGTAVTICFPAMTADAIRADESAAQA